MDSQIIWSPGVPLEYLVKQAILAAMKFYRGNKSAAARSLGISIRTLDTRLEKYEQELMAHEKRIMEVEQMRDKLRDRQRVIPFSAQFDTAATPSQYEGLVIRRRKAATDGE